jgi:hypothetical protein
MDMVKWEWKDFWYDGREFDTDKKEQHALKMSYLDMLVSLECAVMGIEPTLNSNGIIFMNEDDVQWDFEDVLRRAMEFNNTEPK